MAAKHLLSVSCFLDIEISCDLRPDTIVRKHIDIPNMNMLCSRCECSYYLARSLLTYTSTLVSGCMVMMTVGSNQTIQFILSNIKIGLIIASVVMRYQMSLLEWEKRLIADEMDLYSRMENVGCSQHSYFALHCSI